MTPVPGNGPIQIIGSPRSGTSALSWALNEHAALMAGPESDFVWHLCGNGKLHDSFRLSVERGDDTWLSHFGMRFPEYCRALGHGVDAVFTARADGRRWIDSTPSHTLMAVELAFMLPQLRFLHLVRDGRDVVASMINSGFGEEWCSDFDTACVTWAHYIDVGLAFEAQFPHRVLRVDHAALVADPVGECGRVLAFLDCAPDPAPATFIATQRVNSSYDNARPDDIRAPKSTARLRDPGWLGWSEARQQRFWQLAGAQMQQVNLAPGAIVAQPVAARVAS